MVCIVLPDIADPTCIGKLHLSLNLHSAELAESSVGSSRESGVLTSKICFYASSGHRATSIDRSMPGLLSVKLDPIMTP